MRVSKEQLNEYINLYLNDVEDYGDNDDHYILAESVLNNLKQSLLTENIFDIKQIINESLGNESQQNYKVLDDFLVYIENI